MWYRTLLWTYQCMIDHGDRVTNHLSLESYAESEGANWHSYNAVMQEPTLSEEAFRDLEETCPQDRD